MKLKLFVFLGAIFMAVSSASANDYMAERSYRAIFEKESPLSHLTGGPEELIVRRLRTPSDLYNGTLKKRRRFKLYDSFLRPNKHSFFRVTRNSNKVHVLNMDGTNSDIPTTEIKLFVDFDAAEGTKSNFYLDECHRETEIVSKHETVTVPAGTFNNVIHIKLSGTCADAGTQDAWFAVGVGLIQWYETSFLGRTTYKLKEAEVDGVTFAPSTGPSLIIPGFTL